MNIWERCLELLYPNTCCFCGKINKSSRCFVCEKEIEYVKEPVCKICGKPIHYEEKECCSDCEGQTFFFEQGKSVWLHKGPVRWSVYQFKYHNRRIYGKYNQAAVLAKYLGKKMQIPVDESGVVRKKNTKPQKALENKNRKKNVKGAFVVKRMRDESKNILIIDDIYTTGSTINEMAKCLTKKGAQKVFFLTISIGQGF